MTRFHSRGRCAGARGAGLAATLVLAASIAGCGPAATGLQPDTASHLQELVRGVSQAAAANDHAAALTALENLEADVASAAGSGQVSEERRRSILTSITAVRADLNAAAASAASAAKAAEEAAVAAAEAEKAKADREAAQAAQENTAPVEPAAIPGPVPAPEQGKGAEGKGKNKNG